MMKTPAKKEMLYEGKAKKVWTTDAPDELVIEYKDDATALNGKRKETIEGKGLLNNRISNRIFAFLNDQGIPTHFVNEIDERNAVVRHAEMIPLEVVVRNIAAGSFSKRLGMTEGQPFQAGIEFHLKNDELDDPMVSGHDACFGTGRRIRVRRIVELALEIDKALSGFFLEHELTLVDFKLEFGRFKIRSSSPTKCLPTPAASGMRRSGEKLDKDRFRRNLGNVKEAYEEVARRLGL
ncbi:MAG: phosphoribosylaminoimidazolesuccinocarboxamide synthase [Slackia sp.]